MIKALSIASLILSFSAFGLAQSDLRVSGRVVDYNGQPVAGAFVSVGPTGPLKGVMPNTIANSRGEFSVAVNQTGNFFVSAHKTAANYPSTANLFYYPHPNAAALVTVIPGQPAPVATVQFGPKAGKLVMNIVDAETNQPIKGVRISLCRVEAPKHCHRFSASTRNGWVDTLVPSAPFTIEVSAEGYADSYGETDQGVQSLRVLSETVREMTVTMRKPSLDSDLLPAPKIVSPVDGAVFWNTPYPRSLTLEWAAVPKAATYTVEVEVCDREPPDGGACKKATYPLVRWRQAPPSGIEGTTYQMTFPGTQPGRWRVWAVDANGRPGAKTPWTVFLYKWRQ